MTTNVDDYLVIGCGRCPLGGTPRCKVLNWTAELTLLREIILSCGWREGSKWGVACYTFQEANVLLLSAFKGYVSVSFFKGAILQDPQKLLVKPGPRSQAARILKITNVESVQAIAQDLRAYIFEAIEIEKAGLKVELTPDPEPIPDELTDAFEQDPLLKVSFDALTPGKQRGYLIYFSTAKQAETRRARIEKCSEKILNGEGLHDKYQRGKKK